MEFDLEKFICPRCRQLVEKGNKQCECGYIPPISKKSAKYEEEIRAELKRIGEKIINETEPEVISSYFADMGALYKKDGDIDKASKCYIMALKVFDSAPGHFGMAEIFKDYDMLTNAKECYKNIFTKYGVAHSALDESIAKWNMAEIDWINNDFDTAYKQFCEVLKKEKKKKTMTDLAKLYWLTDHLDLAKECYKVALEAGSFQALCEFAVFSRVTNLCTEHFIINDNIRGVWLDNKLLAHNLQYTLKNITSIMEDLAQVDFVEI